MSDLQEAIALIKTGRKDQARKVLVKILRAQPDNEKAWLCMVSCAVTIRQLEVSIQNVLRINPQNPTALKLARKYHIAITEEDNSPTVPSRATAPFKPDAIKQMMVEVERVLAENPPEPVTPLNEPTIATSAYSEHSREMLLRQKTTVKRLWWLVGVAVVILISLVVFIAVSEIQEENETTALQTARYVASQSTEISRINASIAATIQRGATEIAATETAYYAALYRIFTARILSNGEIVESQVFASDEPIALVVQLFNKTGQLEVQVLHLSPTGEQLIESKTSRLENEQLLLTFARENWEIGNYVAVVYLNGEAEREIRFSVQ